MKKNKEMVQERKGKSRRLKLNRETLQVLDAPALLEAVEGGGELEGGQIIPTSCSGSTATAC